MNRRAFFRATAVALTVAAVAPEVSIRSRRQRLIDALVAQTSKAMHDLKKRLNFALLYGAGPLTLERLSNEQ